jgi:hypothetical protein
MEASHSLEDCALDQCWSYQYKSLAGSLLVFQAEEEARAAWVTLPA